MQLPWRVGRLIPLLRVLLVLSATPASIAARGVHAAEHSDVSRPREANLLRRSARFGDLHVTAERQVASLISSYPGDTYLKKNEGKDGYYSKVVPSENFGDTSRGTGKCTAWRSTLNCNPSGPRDARQDKGCNETVTGSESGYCECGDYAQFATSTCGHRPFTCDVMCLKFAVVTKKPAYYQGELFSHDDAKTLLKHLLDPMGQTDMVTRRRLLEDQMRQREANMKLAQKLGEKANEAVNRYVEKMKEAQNHETEATEKVKHQFEELKINPYERLAKEADNLIKAGRGIQEKVKETMPCVSSMSDFQAATPSDAEVKVASTTPGMPIKYFVAQALDVMGSEYEKATGDRLFDDVLEGGHE